MVMIRDGGSEKGGEGAHIYCGGIGGRCDVKTEQRQESEWDGNEQGCICLHLQLKYETQKQHMKIQEKNGNRVLSSNQITSSSTADRPPILPLPPSLYPSLFSILSLSTPSLSVMLKHLVRSAVSGAQ